MDEARDPEAGRYNQAESLLKKTLLGGSEDTFSKKLAKKAKTNAGEKPQAEPSHTSRAVLSGLNRV